MVRRMKSKSPSLASMQNGFGKFGRGLGQKNSTGRIHSHLIGRSLPPPASDCYTPQALREELQKRISKEIERQAAVRVSDWTKLEHSPWLGDLMSVPAFTVARVKAHSDALEKLETFVINPDEGRIVFALAGEPQSGKGGLLKALVEKLYKDSTNRERRVWCPVLYLNLPQLRGFEPVVSRIDAFLTAVLSAKSSKIPISANGQEEVGGPIELKLQRIVRALKELKSGALFLFGGVEALASGKLAGASYVLH